MPNINPEILRWTREKAGLSLEDASHKLAIRPERLADFESGKSQPTRRQLVNMANKYHRPLLTFYISEPPREANRGEDFRTLPQGEEPTEHALLDALLRDVRARQSMVRSVLEDEEVEALPFVGSATMSDGPSKVLESIRKSLGLELKHYRSPRNVSDAFSYLRNQVEAKGIFVLLKGNLGSYHTDIDVEVFRGFVLADDLAPFIVLNENDSHAAWSFSLLHELVHLWLGQTGISGENADQTVERFCNDVAGEFLFPTNELAVFGDPSAMNPNDIAEKISGFSGEHNLSRVMVAYKLFRNDRISHVTWKALNERFRIEWKAQKDAQKERGRSSSGGPTYYVVRRHRIGKALIEIVSQMLSAGEMTTVKAGKVLGVNPNNVGRLISEGR